MNNSYKNFYEKANKLLARYSQEQSVFKFFNPKWRFLKKLIYYANSIDPQDITKTPIYISGSVDKSVVLTVANDLDLAVENHKIYDVSTWHPFGSSYTIIKLSAGG